MKELALRVCLLLSMIFLASSPALAGPLHKAVKAGHLDKVKPLIASGADVNALDNFHNPPLYWAATKAADSYRRGTHRAWCEHQCER